MDNYRITCGSEVVACKHPLQRNCDRKVLGIFISFSSLNRIIKKNGMLFECYGILPPKYAKGIEQSPLSLHLNYKFFRDEPCERWQKTLDFSLRYITYCPPPFRRKAGGHSFWLSVLPSVRLSVRPPDSLKYYMYIVCATPPTVLCWFFWNFTDALSWSDDVHVVWILSWDYFVTFSAIWT